MNAACLVEYFENISSNKDEENINAILKGYLKQTFKMKILLLKIYQIFIELTDNKVTLKTLFDDLE